MKYSSVLLSLFALSAISSIGAEIPQGAHVLLRMENSLNKRTAQTGDFVYLRTAVPIASSGEIAVRLEAMYRAWLPKPSGAGMSKAGRSSPSAWKR